jgi:hypothetical protein
VAAAVFVAVAAYESGRVAAESSASARRAQEAVARNTQPHLQPGFNVDGARLFGTVNCGSASAALDVMVAWLPVGGPISGQCAVFEAGAALAVDLGLPAAANVRENVRMVWLDYWDQDRIARWHDTWRIGTETGDQSILVLAESRLVD